MTDEMTSETELLTCREMVRLITDYLEDALVPAERLRFEQHLSVCDGCTAYLDQMRQLTRLTGELSEDQLPEPVKQEFLKVFANWKQERSDR